MPTFRTSLDIAAPPARAWEVLTDLERWPEWTASVTRVTRPAPGPFGVGAQARIEQPRLRPATWTVTLCEPGRSFAWVSHSPGLRVIADHVIAERPGGCVITLAVHYRGPLSLLVGLLAGPLTRQYLALEATGLRRRCEGRG